MKKLPLLGVVCAALLHSNALASNGSQAAISAIPEDYSDAIVKMSGKGCAPNPETWIVLAYEGEIGDGPKEFKVAGGQVVGDHASFAVGQLAAHGTAIDRSRVRLDSATVFEIAQAQLGSEGGRVVSADMTLTQDGDGADPVWAAVGYDENGTVVGSIEVSANTAAILDRKIKSN